MFCSKNVEDIDFRNVGVLKRYISAQFKIIDRRYTGVCAKHQRQLAKAIKRSRRMGLLPFS